MSFYWGIESIDFLRDIKEEALIFPVLLLLLLVELEFYSCGYLLLGLLKDYFLAFSKV